MSIGSIEQIKIDIGCGAFKREGFLGIDLLNYPSVDYVIDLTKDQLPFKDNTVDYVYSHHFFEHIVEPSNILREILRVCKHGAIVEIWTPYLKSNDAFILGHINHYNETIFEHFCYEYDEDYFGNMNGRFEMFEYRYVLYPGILDTLKNLNIPFKFAIEHLFNIAKNFGVFMYIDKTRNSAKKPQNPEIKIAYSFSGPFITLKDIIDPDKNMTAIPFTQNLNHSPNNKTKKKWWS